MNTEPKIVQISSEVILGLMERITALEGLIISLEERLDIQRDAIKELQRKTGVFK